MQMSYLVKLHGGKSENYPGNNSGHSITCKVFDQQVCSESRQNERKKHNKIEKSPRRLSSQQGRVEDESKRLPSLKALTAPDHIEIEPKKIIPMDDDDFKDF